MSQTRSAWFGVLMLWSTLGFAARHIQIEFNLEVPRHFRETDAVFLTGNIAALGNWDPAPVKMTSLGDGKFRAVISVPSSGGAPIEYKFTLGDWAHAETENRGGERDNRVANCTADCVLHDRAENFRLRQFHPVPRTAAANIHYHFDFYSAEFDNYRNVAVLLPPQYFENPAGKFPVLYALDGNNLFDRATSGSGEEWAVDETLNSLFAKAEVAPFIVVGIYNTARRADEYLSCKDTVSQRGGMADDYAKFIVREIKPFIDRRYRTVSDRDHTWLMGSSFGGVFTLFSARNFGHVFSRFAAVSPAFWWDDYCIYTLLRRPFAPAFQKLWIDTGAREGWDDVMGNFKFSVSDLDKAYTLLVKDGAVAPSKLVKWVEKNGIHHESSWAARFGRLVRSTFAE